MDNHQPDISVLESNWDGIKVKYSQMSATGDFPIAMPQHGVSIALAPHARATWSVDRGDRNTTSVAPGNVLIHSYRDFVWHYREKRSEWIDLQLTPEVLTRIAKESNLPTNLELEHRILFSDPTILHLARLFQAEITKSGIAHNIYIESLQNLLAVHLIRNYSSVGRASLEKQLVKTARPLDIIQVKELQDFIEENLEQKITLKRLAAIAHLSQFHFVRAFKEAIGVTPHQYIIQRRIERAKILLTATPLSIQEIAIAVGNINPSHFTRQFRKHVGATPAAYRKSI